jgi:3-hydroxybutyryl-CoA dehydrogenase/5-formyl-3-hydroxy-2-methylpyridine 4-carboxylate dehydrogenase
MSVPQIVTVVGSGTMGPGIAAVFARAGSTVRVYDISEPALEMARTMSTMAEGVLEQLGGTKADGGSISFHTDLAESLAGTNFVVEAIPEKLDLKKTVLAEVEKNIGDDVIIATNTSGIPVTDIAEALTHPGRFIGMHWSNPPHVIPMIEVIPGKATDKKFVAELVEMVHGFGYEAVLEKEKPGFVENRVLYAILRECLALVDEGIISQKDLDICVRWGIGYKLAVVGPMRLLDMAGLDIYSSVATYLNADLSNRADVSEFATNLVAQGKLGMKTSGGVFEYGEGDVAAKRGEIIKQFIAVRKALPAPLSANQI